MFGNKTEMDFPCDTFVVYTYIPTMDQVQTDEDGYIYMYINLRTLCGLMVLYKTSWRKIMSTAYNDCIFICITAIVLD